MDTTDIKSVFSKAVDKAKDFGSKAYTTTKEVFQKISTAIKDHFDKDDEKQSDEKTVTSDAKQLMVNDLDAIASGNQYDDTIMRSALMGSEAAIRLQEDGKSAEDIEKISSAVSQVSANIDVINMTNTSGSGRTEELKGVFDRVSKETGVDQTTLTSMYNACKEETDTCMNMLKDSVANGTSIDDAALEQHPALRMISDTDSALSKGQFDADAFLESDSGKAFLEEYADDSAGNTNVAARQASVVKACAPAVTQSIVQENITHDMKRNAQMASEASQGISASVDESVDAIFDQ